jgi:ornithine cyclodeaminase/alanine dehydrogenase-like protein (mu-crystallin family)
MPDALLLTYSDFLPLREDPNAIHGALKAVEDAVKAQQAGIIRQHNVVDRYEGEFEGIRVALTAGEGLMSGMRLFGNPPHMRAYMLFDGVTRAPIAFMDYGVLNSMRVGSIAGLAGKYLAPTGAKTMALIGSGWQAPPQVLAMTAGVPTLERIKVYSPTQAHREEFATQMTARIGIPVEPVASTQEAIDDADVVDLCAPGHFDLREPLFDGEWIKPGALVVSMAPSQSRADFVARSRVVSLWHSLTTPEARPPFKELIEDGRLTEKDVLPLGAVIDGANPRRSPDDNVLYHLEGGTAHDLFVAMWGYEWAVSKGLGKPFDLRA